MGKPIQRNWGSRVVGKIGQTQPKVLFSNPAGENSFASETYTNKYGQNTVPEELRRHGYPVIGNEKLSQPYFEKQVVRYPAKNLYDLGFFNGFPFLLDKKVDYLHCPVDEVQIGSDFTFLPSGISQRNAKQVFVDVSDNSTSELGGTYDLSANQNTFEPDCLPRSVAANNFWNLACIETDWAIHTTSAPAEYQTGYCYNPDGQSTSGIQLVTQDFEVVDSVYEQSFPPNLRQYAEITGSKQTQSINDDGLIVGSGQNFSSCFFLGDNTGNYANAFFPLTIQPDNTGAFVITLDEGVANFFDAHSQYGSKKAFNCNMMFDFNIQNRDEEGFERNAIEYHSFPTKAYIVPAAGWDFEVICSKVKGIYYQYDFNPAARFVGDQASFRNYRPLPNGDLKIIHQRTTTSSRGYENIIYNGLGYTHMPFEPAPSWATNVADFNYGHYFKFEKGKIYLDPKEGEDGDDSIYRQSFTVSGSYSTQGSYNQTKPFDVVAPQGATRERDTIVMDEAAIQLYYNKDKMIAERPTTYKTMPASFFTKTPYKGMTAAPNLPKGVNPRKVRDKMSRPIPEETLRENRMINVKVRDLVQQKVSKNPVVGCGIRKSVAVPQPFPDFKATSLPLKRSIRTL
tara:strand:+ start:14517 stop:16388 length:1872 start_codon:yes stop_codon:yes gene_type:complete